jgi:subtilase family serine protease
VWRVCAWIFAFSFSLGSPPLMAQENRIVGKVDESRRILLKGNVHPKAQGQYDQGPVDPSLKLSYITLALKKSAAQQAALDDLLQEQQNFSSQLLHRWLTPEQYADRFGASESDIAKLAGWLRSRGFTVIQAARGRDFIAFSGTAQQVENALKTSVHHYLVDGKMHYANATEPSVPEAFAGLAGAFLGLDDFYPERPKAGHLQHPDFLTSVGNVLAPADLATIYDISPLYQNGFDGTGQTLVVAGQTNIDLADVRVFRTRFNLPPNDPRLVLVPGDADPGILPDQLAEADIDLELSGAIARNATILFVYANNVLNSVQYAIDSNLAPVITYSFGACEQGITSAAGQYLESVAKKGNSQGITWIASSGDSGAAGCEKHSGTETTATTGLSVSLPASIPEVTGVGGTEFSEGAGSFWTASNNSNGGTAFGYIPEISWNDLQKTGFAASGGGASTLFPKPPWQSGPGVPNDGQRDIPDVALNASWDHDSYFAESGGQTLAVGGTSAAAPTFAGIVVLLNQYLTSTGAQSQPGLGNINPNLYWLAQNVPGVFHDITSGNNIVSCTSGSPDCSTGSFGYTAGPGYDQVTGLGSIDANNLVTNWTSSANAAVTLQVTNYLIYPVNISVNGSLVGSIKASGTDSLTILAPPTLQVSFELARPSPFGLPLGDPMVGYYNTISNPAGTYAFKINNQIGNQFYFAPFVTNTTSARVLMDVNAGLSAENKCFCVAPAGSSNVTFGYYRLYTNSNVRVYRDGSNYTGPFEFWGNDPSVAPNGNFDPSVATDTGILRLTLNTAP